MIFEEYIRAAMRQAQYEYIEEDKVFFGNIPLLQGAWATGETIEAAREELMEVVEGWIILSLRKNLPIPSINGISFEFKEAA